jgi:hypothetical protein
VSNLKELVHLCADKVSLGVQGAHVELVLVSSARN